MNLILEQGNTNLKAAIFDGESLVSRFSVNGDNVDGYVSWIDEIVRQHRPTKSILASVGDDEALINYLQERLPNFILFDEHTPAPIDIMYESKTTLGKDRLAAVVGANYLQPERNLLVIDAGTAITYEVVEATDGVGIYRGGNISPGLTTRFRALNHFTKRLPLVTMREEIPLVGVSTESAILSGVVNSIVYEMDGWIDALTVSYGNIFVFLTGGDAFYFEKRLKNRTFATANLVLIGLNRIVEYNAE